MVYYGALCYRPESAFTDISALNQIIALLIIFEMTHFLQFVLPEVEISGISQIGEDLKRIDSFRYLGSHISEKKINIIGRIVNSIALTTQTFCLVEQVCV